MRDSLGRIRELWQNTSRINQILVIALSVAAILVAVGFVYIAGTPEYRPLVTNASNADSNKIVKLLKERKVNYRIDQDTQTIEVPAAQQAELRMSLAGAGLLEAGSLGYGLLDKVPLGQTQAMEQMTILRAREGEMEKSIQSLEPVSSANVKLAEGDESVFVNPDRKEPSASVVVHLKPGQELSKENIRAIVSLVQCAFTGLSSKKITVVDGEMNLLWDGAEVDSAADPGDRLAQERAYREAKARDLKQLISKVVPPSKTSVTVHAELNLDRQTETKREVTAGAKVEQSVEEETLNGGGSISSPRVPVGTAANASGAIGIPTYAGSSVDTDSGKYSHTISTSKSSPGYTETQTVKAPGEVRSLRVSVLLDRSVPPDTARAVEDIIRNDIGATPGNPTGTRSVIVQTVAFDRSAEATEKRTAERAEMMDRVNRWLGYGVPLVLMLLMLFILARSLRRPVPVNGGLAALTGGPRPALAAAGAGSGLDLIVGDGLPSGISVTEALADDASKVGSLEKGGNIHTFEVIEEAFDSNLESILHLSRTKPDMVAQLVRTWMREES